MEFTSEIARYEEGCLSRELPVTYETLVALSGAAFNLIATEAEDA